MKPFWESSLKQFTTLEPPNIDAAAKERHRIYSLLLCALIHDKWNGNKYGEVGDYGKWRKNQELATIEEGRNVYKGGSYLGHNIAALAVDGEGRIMDFDFNHNDVFDSTVEHAESRLVRRLFALTQIYDPWEALKPNDSLPGGLRAIVGFDQRLEQRHSLFATAASDRPAPPRTGTDLDTGATPLPPYSTLLKDVTIYTSLESCAQCSGIMCLASVKDIVYLQWDQGQFLIGNMMWQATKDQKKAHGFGAPRPIGGDDFDFEYFTSLNNANENFRKEMTQGATFYEDPGSNTKSDKPSVTSFLCTDAAYDIFKQATEELENLKATGLKYPEWGPKSSALKNDDALRQAKDFLEWVRGFDRFNRLGSRGAPHRV
ncbi:hypothetical protein A5678_05040 [Mycobacterium sp. E2733]|nr:hypothetical protein A5678_05040 [Mycobacterium sp. E2733]